MTPERWHKIRELYERSLELPENDRDAYVRDVCADDLDLRAQVLGMLDSGDIDDTALAGMPGVMFREQLGGNEADVVYGTMIGPFKVLEELGEGGMGVVYLAEQTEPIRRRVAVKVIKLGMDTKLVVARFEAERQALAEQAQPAPGEKEVARQRPAARSKPAASKKPAAKKKPATRKKPAAKKKVAAASPTDTT